MTLFDLSSESPCKLRRALWEKHAGIDPEKGDEFLERIDSQVNTKVYIHEHPLDSTEQLVKILRNHRGISDNLQMTCKRQVLACCNRWCGKSNS